MPAQLNVQLIIALASIGSLIIAILKLISFRKRNISIKAKLKEKNNKIDDLEKAIYEMTNS